MTFDIQPVLENELVRLRPLQQKDFDDLFQVASDPLIWTQHQTEDRWLKKGFELFFADSLRSGGALLVLDNRNEKVIGSSRFHFPLTSNCIEIGWSFLARNYWGGKYNKAIKSLMIEHAFRYVDEIIFYIDRHNIRSQKAVIKIGAKKLTNPDLVAEHGKSENDLIFILHKINSPG